MAYAFILKFIKRSALLFLLALAAYKISLHLLSDGFSPQHLEADLSHESESINPLAFNVLSQKFNYYGKGSQSFVFVSEDKRYVLKFFRLNRYRMPQFLTSPSMPSFLKEIYAKKINQKQENLNNFITSCKIAQSNLNEETGLIYLHLNKTENLPKICLCDKLQRPFEVDLNNTYFILQKRGELLYHYLIECKKKGDLAKAERAVTDLFSLIKSRQQKGIGDRDAVISKNAGFLECSPLFFDIGEFYHSSFDDEASKNEIIKISNNLALWLSSNYPSLLPCLHEIINTTNSENTL